MQRDNAKTIIKNTLLNTLGKKDEYKVFLFWSRVIWNYRKNSDYDIWIIKWKNRIDFLELIRMKSELNELPYLIDLVDFNDVSDDFKSLALKKIEKWN